MKYDTSSDEDLKRAKDRFMALIESKSIIELKKVSTARSITQNAYLHVIIALFAIEFGYTIEEAKIILKRECEFMRYEKNGEIFLKKTSKMQSDELAKFIEWLIIFMANQGLKVLTSNEYKENKIKIDNEIEKHKKYL